MSTDMTNYIKQRDENKQVSTTGARALVLYIALLEGPKSYEEIRQYMIDCGVVDKEYSIDTIRIDISTLKSIGCEISKATKKTNRKYGLISSPFNLEISTKEVDLMKDIYTKTLKTASPEKLIRYHKLFIKMASLVEKEETKEALLGISILKSAPIEVLDELTSNEKHNKVKILYAPPNQKTECEYEITVEKFGIRSGKLYLYGYNHTLNTKSFLSVTRIKAVLEKIFDRKSVVGIDTKVTFKLRNYNDFVLEENETITEKTEEDALVEGVYFNDFIALQRMLSFASDCTVISPDKIKTAVIAKLKEMRARYD